MSYLTSFTIETVGDGYLDTNEEIYQFMEQQHICG